MCVSDFKSLFQTGDINIFVLHGVFFSRYVQLKSSSSNEKTLAVKSETYFSREAIDNQRCKVLKESSITVSYDVANRVTNSKTLFFLIFRVRNSM